MKKIYIFIICILLQNISLSQDINLSQDSTSTELKVFNLENRTLSSEYELMIFSSNDTFETNITERKTQYFDLKPNTIYNIKISKSGYYSNSFQIEYKSNIESMSIEVFLARENLSRKAKRKGRKFILNLPLPFCVDGRCGGFKKMRPGRGNIWQYRISIKYKSGDSRTRYIEV